MTQESIRALLRANPEGMTAAALYQKLGRPTYDCKRLCNAMPDVYIDRWEMSTRKGVGYAPVYVAVEVPANTPRPKEAGI